MRSSSSLPHGHTQRQWRVFNCCLRKLPELCTSGSGSTLSAAVAEAIYPEPLAAQWQWQHSGSDSDNGSTVAVVATYPERGSGSGNILNATVADTGRDSG